MSHGLNSLNGITWGTRKRTTIRVIKGDARSVGYSLLIWNSIPCAQEHENNSSAAKYVRLGS